MSLEERPEVAGADRPQTVTENVLIEQLKTATENVLIEQLKASGAMATALDLDLRFTCHAPFGNQPERYTQIRDEAKFMARTIVALTPHSREQSLALTSLEEAVFWANAAIARREERPAEEAK